jgi:hypothetical protein
VNARPVRAVVQKIDGADWVVVPTHLSTIFLSWTYFS